jgi:hypothetical protein
MGIIPTGEGTRSVRSCVAPYTHPLAQLMPCPLVHDISSFGHPGLGTGYGLGSPEEYGR